MRAPVSTVLGRMPGQSDAQKVRHSAREPGMADFDPKTQQEITPDQSPEDAGIKDVNAEAMADEALRRVEAVAQELRSQAAEQLLGRLEPLLRSHEFRLI